MPKVLLLVFNKPLIQCALEEVIKSNIDKLIFVTVLNKCAIEDHFDANNEFANLLRAKNRMENSSK